VTDVSFLNMNFENPNILYAFLLLLIPIIIHLVRWKKYKTVLFTNVQLLQEVEIKSRKSKLLKELLVLLLRLLAFSFLILAFAKAYFPSKNMQNQIKNRQNIIYLDNSLSLSAPHNKLNLWQEFTQDLQQNISDNQNFTLVTNDKVYNNIQGKKLKKILDKISFSNKITQHNKVLKKLNLLVQNKKSTAEIIYLTDLQNVDNEALNDNLFKKENNYHFYIKQVTNLPNISIDSIWITEKDAENYHFKIQVSANRKLLESPVSVQQNDNVLWQSYVKFTDSLTKTLDFDLPAEKKNIAARAQITDQGFQFDNKLYFAINKAPKIKILIIGQKIPEYLNKIYTPDEFELNLVNYNQLNISKLNNYDLIVLNKLSENQIPANALQKYVSQYGNLLILPKIEQPENFTKVLSNLKIHTQISLDTNQVLLTRINFDHPIFKGVFLKKTQNFAYPYIKKHYHFSKPGQWLYQLNDHSNLMQVYKKKGNIFILNTDLANDNSNLTAAADLIVPLFYQIALTNNHNKDLYYVLGQKNTWNIKTDIQPDLSLSLENEQTSFIPMQQNQNEQINVTSFDLPQQAGIYDIIYNNQKIGSVAYNYNRKENKLDFLELPNLKNVDKINHLKSWISAQENATKKQYLWKWFIMLALLFLILEMLVIKLWK